MITRRGFLASVPVLMAVRVLWPDTRNRDGLNGFLGDTDAWVHGDDWIGAGPVLLDVGDTLIYSAPDGGSFGFDRGSFFVHDRNGQRREDVYFILGSLDADGRIQVTYPRHVLSANAFPGFYCMIYDQGRLFIQNG